MSTGPLETIPGQPDYHAPRLLRRSAANQAAFLVPHLRPGMRVLDCGSGPGSITLGLAEIVAPGEVIGVDPDARRVEMAQALAAERSVANVRFEQAGVHSLPFADGSFDAAFMHAVSEHISEPVAAFREIRRVLKPGGVFGVRTAEHGAALSWPPRERLARFVSLMAENKASLGQNLYIGRSLRALVREAGFQDVIASASVETAGTPEESRRLAEEFSRVVLESPLSRSLVEQGRVDRAEIEQMAADVAAWGEDPDMFYAVTWCEAIGWVR